MLIIHPLMNWQRHHIVLQPTRIRELRPIYSVTVKARPPWKSGDTFGLESLDTGIPLGDQHRKRKRTNPVGKTFIQRFNAREPLQCIGEAQIVVPAVTNRFLPWMGASHRANPMMERTIRIGLRLEVIVVWHWGKRNTGPTRMSVPANAVTYGKQTAVKTQPFQALPNQRSPRMLKFLHHRGIAGWRQDRIFHQPRFGQ